MQILNNIRDTIKTSINRYLYDFTNPIHSNLKWEEINTIVLCKIDGKLGDAQVISPFIRTIQKEYPHIEITVITSPQTSQIYSQCLTIENTIQCCPRPSRRDLEQIAAKIGKCNLFITIEEKFRFHDFYILHLLKPKFIAGINKSVKSINIKINEKLIKPHITDYLNNLLLIGGIKKEKILKDYTKFITDDARILANSLSRKRQIAFSPWGASKHKHLPDDVVLKISKLVIDNNINLVLLVPPKANYLKDLLQNRLNTNLLIKTPEVLNIFELNAFIEKSDAIISVDTATVHLACAFNLPIFGIYNGDNIELVHLWRPLSSNSETEIFYVKSKQIDKLSFDDVRFKISSFIKNNFKVE